MEHALGSHMWVDMESHSQITLHMDRTSKCTQELEEGQVVAEALELQSLEYPTKFYSIIFNL